MSSEVIEYYQKKINQIKNLPTLPVIATEIMRITRNDNYSVSQIQTVIEKDPPLAMKVLKVANSAYYGVKHTVKSLRHAVVLIGMRQLSNIAISFSVLKKFEKQSSNIDWESFWEHSIAVGFVSELLIEDYGIISKESPYTMGLLHDIGKLILNIIEPEKYYDIYLNVKKNQTSFYETEINTLGISHCEIGKMLATKWKMSEKLIEIVANHHSYNEASDENKLICAIVETANHICNVKGLAFGTDFDMENLPKPKSWAFLQDSIKELQGQPYEDFLDEIDNPVKSISEMVKIIQR